MLEPFQTHSRSCCHSSCCRWHSACCCPSSCWNSDSQPNYVAFCLKVKSPMLHISLSSLSVPSLLLNVAFAFDTLSGISKRRVALV